ncbi:MAG: hypothetical protein K2Q22_08190, partial [Cytophagales bacterium]|nr:hypothetical protein [Cytophagales bacterium]
MKRGLSFLWLCLFPAMVMAQMSPHSDLHKAILRQDSLLFQVGFNTCNVAQMQALLSEKFVFVHDKDGVSNRQA